VNAPSVSVIIPTYNSARYIAQSIDSVFAQTRQPAEVLIVDDGSTDETRAVVTAQGDSRIRYIEVPHRGVAAARNRGMDIATGDYLAFLDADDLWRPTMLEKQVSVMERDAGLICSFTNFVRFAQGTGETFPEQFDFYPELATLEVVDFGFDGAFVVAGDAFIQFIGFQEIPAYMQCTLFRRAMLAEMRLDESLRRCEDLEFVSRVFMRGKVAFNREVLADVRRHDSNLTRDNSLMALDKLSALLALQTAARTPTRRAALNDRLVKARIDAATVLIRTDSRLDGVKHYAKALTLPGSGLRKLRGTARIVYELVSSSVASLGSRPTQ
jgi:glycosyltransferase involved in cell wall biosynthesis